MSGSVGAGSESVVAGRPIHGVKEANARVASVGAGSFVLRVNEANARVESFVGACPPSTGYPSTG